MDHNTERVEYSAFATLKAGTQDLEFGEWNYTRTLSLQVSKSASISESILKNG